MAFEHKSPVIDNKAELAAGFTAQRVEMLSQSKDDTSEKKMLKSGLVKQSHPKFSTWCKIWNLATTTTQL